MRRLLAGPLLQLAEHPRQLHGTHAHAAVVPAARSRLPNQQLPSLAASDH